MSYKLTDGYIKPGADGYIKLFKDGYSAFLTSDGYSVAFFSSNGNVFDGGQGIMYLANRSIAPDGYQPSDGGWLYSEGGDGYWSSSRGLVQSISGTITTIAFPSDADYTAALSDYRSKIIQFSGGTTLTATRDVIMPNVAGYQWTVYNNTDGAQSIVFKVTGQTGVTVATGKRCIVYCDGTDIVRVTPDT